MRDPFGALGLPASADLTDDDVRGAWRRTAAATHPDRADGGDPAAFADAAAAYTALRTQAGRTESLADAAMVASGSKRRRPVPRPLRRLPVPALAARRIMRGRPGRLALRALVVVATAWLALAAVGWQPASAAVMAGALTWLARTGRADLGP